MSDALPLPPRPDLKQYKKLAKDFQHACHSGDSGAVRDWAARWAETLACLQGRAITSEARRDISYEERQHAAEKIRSDPRLLAALRGG